GILDAPAVTRVLQIAEAGVRDCYARGVARDSKLWGRLQLLIELAADGSLKHLAQDESQFPDAEVSRCVVQRLSQLSYPAPRGGALKYIQAYRLGKPTTQSDSMATQTAH